jgi:hypothetical protein
MHSHRRPVRAHKAKRGHVTGDGRILPDIATCRLLHSATHIHAIYAGRKRGGGPKRYGVANSYTHMTLKPIRHTDPPFHLLLRHRFKVGLTFRDRNRTLFPVSRNPPTLRIFASADAGYIYTSRFHSESTGSPAWFLSTSHPTPWRNTYSNPPSFIKVSYFRDQPRGRIVRDCDQGCIE